MPIEKSVAMKMGLTLIAVVGMCQAAYAQPLSVVVTAANQAVPTAPAPNVLPPPPTELGPPPIPDAVVSPAAPQVVVPPQAVAQPQGQWVFTQQYGWLWQPYDQGYTYVDERNAAAYQYAYYPAFGWRWVAAPWVLGLGVTPHWGSRGPRAFAWYAHPWFHAPRVHVRVQRFGGWGHGRVRHGWHRWP